jgi:hypothetical protein
MKGYGLALSDEEFYCSSCIFYCLGCGLFEATAWMAGLESTRSMTFLKVIGQRSSCSAMPWLCMCT